MATRADEFEPSRDVIEQVIVEAIQPLMVRFEQERGFSMTALLIVWIRESPGNSLVVSSTLIDRPVAVPRGEMRLRFRRTYRPERLLFSFNAFYEDLDPETGFSGFTMKGDIILSQDKITVRPNGWTGIYNYVPDSDYDPWYGW